jgi:hypothetical protein
MKLWKCPDCGRSFAKRNQAHSCLAQSLNRHFQGKAPQLRQIYEELVARLRKLGPLRVDAVKSSINFASKYHFGGLSVKRDYVRLGFLSEEVITDERIIKTERVGPNRVGHVVILRSRGDVDAQLMKWLKQAFTLQLQ